MAAYQVLARKYRPSSFAGMVGQQHVLKALSNALDGNRLHHAYLFSGTRGVGKTSIARIMAKALNCEQGVSSTPCGQCVSCQEIAEGRFADLLELDAASRSGVDDMRQLLDNVQYAPVKGRYKIYLVDEVHMLSTASFNAMLKTLEEPPPHVKFLLATTDPQKLPITVLSRCLQFNLAQMSVLQIESHLEKILTTEGIQYDAAALWLLAEAGQGSMRDALSLTDQAVAHGGGVLVEDDVAAMLGSVNPMRLVELLQCILADDLQGLYGQVQDMHRFSPNYLQLSRRLLDVFHLMTLMQVGLKPAQAQGFHLERLGALAAGLAAEQLQFYYQIALEGHKDIARHPSPAAAFEMLLLRLHAFRPAHMVLPKGWAVAPPLLPAARAQEPATLPAADQPSPETVQVNEARGLPVIDVQPVPEAGAVQVREPQGPPVVDVQPVLEPGMVQADENQKQFPAPAAALKPAVRVTSPAEWLDCLEQAMLGDVDRSLLMASAFVGFEAGLLTLRLPDTSRTLMDETRLARAATALEAIWGEPVRIRAEWGVPTERTAGDVADERAASTQAERVANFREQPGVRLLKDAFDGQIDEASIRPSDTDRTGQ